MTKSMQFRSFSITWTLYQRRPAHDLRINLNLHLEEQHSLALSLHAPPLVQTSKFNSTLTQANKLTQANTLTQAKTLPKAKNLCQLEAGTWTAP